jgi:hypothetical protein
MGKLRREVLNERRARESFKWSAELRFGGSRQRNDWLGNAEKSEAPDHLEASGLRAIDRRFRPPEPRTNFQPFPEPDVGADGAARPP